MPIISTPKFPDKTWQAPTTKVIAETIRRNLGYVTITSACVLGVLAIGAFTTKNEYQNRAEELKANQIAASSPAYVQTEEKIAQLTTQLKQAKADRDAARNAALPADLKYTTERIGWPEQEKNTEPFFGWFMVGISGVMTLIATLPLKSDFKKLKCRAQNGLSIRD